MQTRDFGMGFFGRMPFGAESREAMHRIFAEKWSAMTDEEKLKFMNSKMEAFKNGEHGHGPFGKREFSVEAIDKRCEEWMKMTPEEKEAFVKERKEAFQHKHSGHGGFFGHGRFGFDSCHEDGDKKSEMK